MQIKLPFHISQEDEHLERTNIIFATGLLVLSLVILVFIIQTPQEIRQRAQTSAGAAPQCEAAANNSGICRAAGGCFIGEEADVGRLDCGGGQTCCGLADVPPACAAASTGDRQNFCATTQACAGYTGIVVGQLDCAAGTVCCHNPSPLASTPVPTATPKPTATPVPTATPKPTAVPTPTRVPTLKPTTTIAPTSVSTPQPSGTTALAFTISLHGIGNSGDSMSPANKMSNKNPLRSTREFVVTIESNGLPIKTQSMLFSYNSGAYTGEINLGSGWNTGTYILKVKTQSFLEKNLAARLITAGIKTNISAFSLVAGDINGDSAINTLDYNMIINCFAISTTSCSSDQKQQLDLNDDGAVDGIDYNLFLRAIAGR